MDRKNESLNYLKQCPKIVKWMNICICCGSMGYNPDMPDKITSRDGNGGVNDMGMCDVCQKYWRDKKVFAKGDLLFEKEKG